MNCPLCGGESEFFALARERRYRRCRRLGSVFMDPQYFLSPRQEKKRYLRHNNDPFDAGYREFVSEVVDVIKREFSRCHRGLDFGAGTGPAVVQMLRESGYDVCAYDPFFRNAPALLDKKYDYITCTEVIEHFRRPGEEFKLLRTLLKKGGLLMCKTEVYTGSVDFEEWYYKNDPTHVFFYTPGALKHICESFGFRDVEISGRLVRYNG